MSEEKKILSDDELNQVSGGKGYNRNEYENAGVLVVGGQYFVLFSNGEKEKISEVIANGIVDGYRLSGQRISDGELRYLIEQCNC